MSSESLTQVAAVLNPATIGLSLIAAGTARGGVRGAAAAVADPSTVVDGGGDSEALKRQKALEAERRAQLAGEAAARADSRRRAETSGQRAGAGGARSTFLGGLGFGSGNTPATGSGSLFGN